MAAVPVDEYWRDCVAVSGSSSNRNNRMIGVPISPLRKPIQDATVYNIARSGAEMPSFLGPHRGTPTNSTGIFRNKLALHGILAKQCLLARRWNLEKDRG